MFRYDRPVRVFVNWRRGCYTLLQDGRLMASARQVRLADVEFRVRESGRRRMLESGRRNIHAYAVGRLVDYVGPSDPRELEPLAGRRVHYDPRRFAFFVDSETEASVTRASAARLDETGVVYTSVTPPSSALAQAV